jgi:hypothetical protein
MHYTPNGKETVDRTSVGFTVAKTPADRQFVMMAPEHLVDIRKAIPAGDANYWAPRPPAAAPASAVLAAAASRSEVRRQSSRDSLCSNGVARKFFKNPVGDRVLPDHLIALFDLLFQLRDSAIARIGALLPAPVRQRRFTAGDKLVSPAVECRLAHANSPRNYCRRLFSPH